MRRAIARGRIFPQSYSTDRRYGRLSLKACALFPLIWANADDQGRLSGDPEEIKYAACPNIDHITKTDIPGLLEELDKNQLIKVYNTSKTQAIQLLDWWEVQRLQWAWPSDYPPPEGWQDRLRYKKSSKEVATVNWGSQVSPQVKTQVSEEHSSGENPGENSGENPGESSGEQNPKRFPPSKSEESPLTTPSEEVNKKRRGKGRGRGNSPEPSGEDPSPPLTGSALIQFLTDTFPQAFGRDPNSRETAQLRDLGKEITSAGGATAKQVHDAFKEACGQNKFSVSYVRAILLDWLGVERERPS